MTKRHTVKHLAEENKPTGTRKPANANPESSRVFFMKLTSYKIQKEVSFNRIANLKTKDIR
jgi:hypothetical protein